MPPNILLVVSDQERQRRWQPADLRLPWRERLIAGGVEFTNHWTHSSPCSPSRATLMTGQYVPVHGVLDNVIMPEHRELAPTARTIGARIRDAGYRSSYIGKWHLSQSEHPDMEAYGYSDWDGNDRHFMGWAGTGVHFDPIIASNAASWLRSNAATSPWFLTVALVNPHDVMWFPIDQPAYHRDHPDDVAAVRQVLEFAKWKEDETLPVYDRVYPEVVDTLPANFADDLLDKPEAHRQWRWDQQHGLWGYIDPDDKASWLRHLDYYAHLHQLADESLGTVLAALDESGARDDTIVVFTSDHGDMCGSHGLRSKGPFVYDEIMRVPLYIRIPGSAAHTTDALASHADLARTIVAMAGGDTGGMAGVDLTPALEHDAPVRDHVMFAMDSAHTERINHTRYAVRGFFDGRYKYARYYGVGGGLPATGVGPRGQGRKVYDVDARFEDQEHEWYDHDADPDELVNLAADRSRRAELREQYERLLGYEAAEFSA